MKIKSASSHSGVVPFLNYFSHLSSRTAYTNTNTYSLTNKHHKYILFDYSLHNQTLENVQSAKYLGITISDNMDWGQQISEISSKATKTLGFLRRNLAFAPESTKEVAYKTLVRSKLEYAAPILEPLLETSD